jgi:EAL domain-containing protein (putative c-di-GMP-specific phosphodiesterase class I)
MHTVDGRDRWSDAPIAAWSTGGAWAAGVWIAALLAGATLACLELGSMSAATPHLFYLPIIVAAARFGHAGALVVALTASVLSGPALDLDAETAAGAHTGATITLRLAMFVVVGQVVAALHARTIADATARIADRHAKTELRSALAAGEFVPAFQPVIDLRSDRVVAVEALARWHLADGEVRSPAEFIPAAERTGVIRELGLSILEQACHHYARWRADGVTAVDQLTVSVNLSRAQLDDEHLAADVAAVLARTGVAAERVVLEVTETALMTDPATASARLHELRELGVRIALDDFGVGQSSLATLHEFPIDILKIDRSFVHAMDRRPHVGAMIRAVVSMAQDLGLDRPVVEGVESPEQLAAVSHLGCGYGQGFLFARPLPPDAARTFLRQQQLASN